MSIELRAAKLTWGDYAVELSEEQIQEYGVKGILQSIKLARRRLLADQKRRLRALAIALLAAGCADAPALDRAAPVPTDVVTCPEPADDPAPVVCPEPVACHEVPPVEAVECPDPVTCPELECDPVVCPEAPACDAAHWERIAEARLVTIRQLSERVGALRSIALDCLLDDADAGADADDE